MATKQRFEAAVNVIKNLPKNGVYKPSHELQLNFYAYFKQATIGPVNCARPAFWDVIGRAKWDAWNRMGDTPKEEAMQKYIDELNKIVETMALTDSVADFLQSMETYPGNPEDIELSIGPLLERVRSSQPGSTETTPSHGLDSRSTTSHGTDDEEDDEFEDTLSDSAIRQEFISVKRKDTPMVMPMANHHLVPLQANVERNMGNGHVHSSTASQNGIDQVNDALQKAIESLRRDLTAANEKVKALEERQNKENRLAKNRNPWFNNQMAPGTLAFIVVWPIAVHYFLSWMRTKKRQ